MLDLINELFEKLKALNDEVINYNEFIEMIWKMALQ
jgi:hypothetical protein